MKDHLSHDQQQQQQQLNNINNSHSPHHSEDNVFHLQQEILRQELPTTTQYNEIRLQQSQRLEQFLQEEQLMQWRQHQREQRERLGRQGELFLNQHRHHHRHQGGGAARQRSEPSICEPSSSGMLMMMGGRRGGSGMESSGIMNFERMNSSSNNGGSSASSFLQSPNTMTMPTREQQIYSQFHHRANSNDRTRSMGSSPAPFQMNMMTADRGNSRRGGGGGRNNIIYGNNSAMSRSFYDNEQQQQQQSNNNNNSYSFQSPNPSQQQYGPRNNNNILPSRNSNGRGTTTATVAGGQNNNFVIPRRSFVHDVDVDLEPKNHARLHSSQQQYDGQQHAAAAHAASASDEANLSPYTTRLQSSIGGMIGGMGGGGGGCATEHDDMDPIRVVAPVGSRGGGGGGGVSPITVLHQQQQQQQQNDNSSSSSLKKRRRVNSSNSSEMLLQMLNDTVVSPTTTKEILDQEKLLGGDQSMSTLSSLPPPPPASSSTQNNINSSSDALLSVSPYSNYNPKPNNNIVHHRQENIASYSPTPLLDHHQMIMTKGGMITTTTTTPSIGNTPRLFVDYFLQGGLDMNAMPPMPLVQTPTTNNIGNGNNGIGESNVMRPSGVMAGPLTLSQAAAAALSPRQQQHHLDFLPLPSRKTSSKQQQQQLWNNDTASLQQHRHYGKKKPSSTKGQKKCSSTDNNATATPNHIITPSSQQISALSAEIRSKMQPPPVHRAGDGGNDADPSSSNASQSPGASPNRGKGSALSFPIPQFASAMESSQASQQAIHDWDRKFGLRRAHSKTMRESCRSRKQVLEFLRGEGANIVLLNKSLAQSLSPKETSDYRTGSPSIHEEEEEEKARAAATATITNEELDNIIDHLKQEPPCQEEEGQQESCPFILAHHSNPNNGDGDINSQVISTYPARGDMIKCATGTSSATNNRNTTNDDAGHKRTLNDVERVLRSTSLDCVKSLLPDEPVKALLPGEPITAMQEPREEDKKQFHAKSA